MSDKHFVLDDEEELLLQEIERGEWKSKPLSQKELEDIKRAWHRISKSNPSTCT